MIHKPAARPLLGGVGATVVSLALAGCSTSDSSTNSVTVSPTTGPTPSATASALPLAPRTSLATLTLTTSQGHRYAVTLERFRPVSSPGAEGTLTLGVEGSLTASDAGRSDTPGATFTLRGLWAFSRLTTAGGTTRAGVPLLSAACDGGTTMTVKGLRLCARDLPLTGLGDPLRPSETEALALSQPALWAVGEADLAVAERALAQPALVSVGVTERGATTTQWSEALPLTDSTPAPTTPGTQGTQASPTT